MTPSLDEFMKMTEVESTGPTGGHKYSSQATNLIAAASKAGGIIDLDAWVSSLAKAELEIPEPLLNQNKDGSTSLNFKKGFSVIAKYNKKQKDNTTKIAYYPSSPFVTAIQKTARVYFALKFDSESSKYWILIVPEAEFKTLKIPAAIKKTMKDNFQFMYNRTAWIESNGS